MSVLMEELLKFNEAFVAEGDYVQYNTSKYPDKKLAVVACMDARLTELLPAAMGLKKGDVALIKTAGGIIFSAFGSVMRSLLVAVYELEVEEIAVVGHYDCGIQGLELEPTLEKMLKRGVQQDDIDLISLCGVDMNAWLRGFTDPHTAVRASMKVLLTHPLMPKDVAVHGFVMDPATGRLDQVTVT